MTVSIFLASLLGGMAVGMPIAFALIACAVALMLASGHVDVSLLSQKFVEGADSFPLLAIPFFVLAGELMNAGGMSRRIVNAALAFVGHIRGGLGFVAVFAAVMMAAISGSAAADAAALGTMLIPMMRQAGYDIPRSAGLIAAGSIIAPVMPPSVAMIVFGVVANVSIGKLFMAGIFPALLMAVSLTIAWLWVVRKDNVSVLPRATLGEMAGGLRKAVWALVMPLGIVGGMKFGVFTPTEAAVAACAYAAFVGMAVYRELKPKDLYPLIVTAAKTTSVIVFLIAAALVSAVLITTSDVPRQLGSLLQPFMDSPRMLMLMMMLLVLVVGTALDFAPTLLILTPVLMPLVKQAGIDPVYFGVLFIMNNAIGLITPPVGVVLNVLSGVSRLSMGAVVKGVTPFLVAESTVLMLLVLFPQLVLVPLKWLT